MQRLITLSLIVLIGAISITWAAPAPQAEPTERQIIEAEEPVESLNVAVQTQITDLTIRGAANAILDGAFFYNDERLQPQVDYRVQMQTGDLAIRQPGLDGFAIGTFFSEWDLALNGMTPLALNVRGAGGDTLLELGDLNLTALDVATADGSATVRADDNLPMLAGLRLDNARGAAALILDGSYAALAELHTRTADGTLTADLTGRYPALITIEAEAERAVLDATLDGEFSALETVSADFVDSRVNLVIDGTQPTLTTVALAGNGPAVAVSLPGAFDQLEDLSIDSVGAHIALTMTGVYDLGTDIRVEGTDGAVDFDVSGIWREALTAQIVTRAGSVRVRVPRNVNARVTTNAGVANVRAPAFIISDEEPGVYDLRVSNNVPTFMIDIVTETGTVLLERAT
ncbi:MAG: hypothetical protein GYB67_04715 [Chloroflexi bacterium]|nr:hypothetical protein [Chloroflexota bacterium]